MLYEYNLENEGGDSFEDAWNRAHKIVEAADCCVIELTSVNADLGDVRYMFSELEDTGISPTSVAEDYKGCIFGLNSYGPTTVTLDSAAVEEFSAKVLSKPGYSVRTDQTLSAFITMVNMCRTPEGTAPVFLETALKSFLSVVKKRMWDMSSGTRLDVAREIKEAVADTIDAHVKHITDMEWLAEKLKTVDDEDAKTSILKLQEKLSKGHE